MTALATAFADPDPSVRLNAIMQAGINPSPSDLEALVRRCAVEPDFQVREMLTWALLRLPEELTVPRIIAELKRPEAQARTQALHTLSKIRNGAAWPHVAARLDDADPEVMRTAWYSAVALVPESERRWLADKLGAQLGRGDREMRLSLSRALVGLGEEAIAPILAAAARHKDETVRLHVAETEELLRDPAAGFDVDVYRARREVGRGRTRSAIG